MTSALLITESGSMAGLPEQRLVLCDPCKAINLPGSNYCCQCGLPLPGGALDPQTRSEVERLVQEARRTAEAGPVWVVAGPRFQSRIEAETVSLWPATLAAPQFISDPWSGLGKAENATVLLIERLDGPISSLVPLLESLAQTGKTLVVVTGYIDPDLLATLTVNHVRNVLKSLVLLLTLPRESHPVLLADMASVLRGKVIERVRLDKVRAAALPVVRQIYAGETLTWACEVAPQELPELEGAPAVVAARRGIYSQKAARLEIGAGSRGGIEAQCRYACRLLREAGCVVSPRSPHLMTPPSQGVWPNE